MLVSITHGQLLLLSAVFIRHVQYIGFSAFCQWFSALDSVSNKDILDYIKSSWGLMEFFILDNESHSNEQVFENEKNMFISNYNHSI